MRLAATAAVGFSTLDFGDARAYLFAARTLAQTGTYPERTEPFFFRPPGYPVFLVAATLGHPERIAAAKVANAVLGALSALLLTLLSARIFRRRGVAIATGIAASLHPAFVVMATEIQSEPLFLFFLLAAGFLLLVAVDRPSSNWAVLAGVCLGVAALTRSTALVLGVLLLAPLRDRRYPPRVRWHLAGSALLGFFLALAPWTIRNAVLFHELLPVSDQGGLSLYHGNSSWTRRYYQLRSKQEYDQWIHALDVEMRRHLAEAEKNGPLSPGRRSRFFARLALEDSRADPRGIGKMMLAKAWHWLRPFPTPWYWPTPIVVATGVYYSVLSVLAVIGLARAPRPGVRAFALGTLGISMAIHVVFLVVWRYRVPYWDPVLVLYGVFGGDTLLSKWRSLQD